MSVVVGSATYAGYRTRTLTVAGQGPRIVLVHGYSDCANTWDRVLAELHRVGRAAVAVDLPGFGLADSLRPGPVMPQLDAFVDALVADQAALGPVVLVGNSLGGTATVRAATRTLPVHGAVTIGDPGAGRWWVGSFVGSRPGGLLFRLLALPMPAGLFRHVMRTALRRLAYGDPRLADPVIVDRFLTWMSGQGGHRALAPQVSGLAAEIVAGRGRAAVVAPLLVVHGAKDRFVPVRGSHDLHAAVAGSRLVIEPSWGHCPQNDDPRALAELIATFAPGETIQVAG